MKFTDRCGTRIRARFLAGWTRIVLNTYLLSVSMFVVPLSAQGPVADRDYGRAEIGGSQGPIVWDSLLDGEGLEGWVVGRDPWVPTAWSRDGDRLVADVDRGRARIVRGDSSWIAYEFKVQATLIKGIGLQIWFGLDDDGGAYHLAYLGGWKAMSIIDEYHTKLDVVNFEMLSAREYDIVLAVRGNSITSYVDGQLVNRLSVAEPPRGGIGMAVWGRGTVEFRDPKIRHYYRIHPQSH